MNAPAPALPREAPAAASRALPPISPAEQERVAALVRQCVPLRHPAFGKLLRLLSIELSREVPTAAVTTGSRSRLLINPDFLAERCRTEEHLAMLVMHELYHVLLGHTRIYRRPTLAANWARRQKGVDGRHVGLAGANLGAVAALMAAPKIKPATILALSPDGMDAFGRDARARMAAATTRAHAAVMAFVSMEDREADENAEPLRPLYGANIRTFEGNRRGLDFLADHSDVMAVFFAEYLLHPHTGRVAEAPKVAAAPEATVLTPEAQAPTTP